MKGELGGRLPPTRWVSVPLLFGLFLATAVPSAPPAAIGVTGDAGLAKGSAKVVARMPSHRAVTLVSRHLDPTLGSLSPDEFTLACPDDAAYREPRPALRVGADRQVVGFVDDRTAVEETHLHLLYSNPLRAGVACRLDGPSPLLRNLPVRWDPQRSNGSIQLNQVGYAPGARKYGYIGNWLGSAGPMPVDSSRFQVVDEETGDAVLSGSLVLRAQNDPWSGNDVYTADFSALKSAGRFRLSVPGLGRSEPFRVAPDVYDGVYRSTGRYFYHHRNSAAPSAPWVEPGYERPGGVPARLDAVFHPAVAESPLGNREPAHGRHALHGGWFDAGDYGQYIPNAAPVWFVFGAALDIAPDRFLDGDLRIPESGNGLPDLVDELDWGMEWALGMQDPADGGVYFRVASATWDDGLPHEIDKPRLVAEKTSHATAAFAAMAAIHARLLATERPARAATALAAARRAWQFLQSRPQWPAEGETYRNPEGVRAGEYPDPSARDNLLWAAAELYRTTGEEPFHEAFLALAREVEIDPTGVVSFKDQGLAAHWAYLMAPWPGRDAAQCRRSKALLLAAADWRVRKMDEHPFHAPIHQYLGFTGWGSFAHSSRATLSLFQAWKLSGNTDYLDWAWLTPHPQLGANPQSVSYITGVGARSPRFPLSKLSQHDGVDDPLPGIPVNGPHARLPALWPSTRAVNAGYFPPAVTEPGADNPGYPVLRRYTDSHHLPPMSEPTVTEAAYTATAFGLLRGANDASTASESPECGPRPGTIHRAPAEATTRVRSDGM